MVSPPSRDGAARVIQRTRELCRRWRSYWQDLPGRTRVRFQTKTGTLVLHVRGFALGWHPNLVKSTSVEKTMQSRLSGMEEYCTGSQGPQRTVVLEEEEQEEEETRHPKICHGFPQPSRQKPSSHLILSHYLSRQHSFHRITYTHHLTRGYLIWTSMTFVQQSQKVHKYPRGCVLAHWQFISAYKLCPVYS
jgi:hypothetical protein